MFVLSADLCVLCEGSWSVDKFPNPRLQPEKCGFTEEYCHGNDCLVCDPDRLLTSYEVVLLNEQLLDRNMPCVCDNCTNGGYPIAVAMAKRIEWQSDSSGFLPDIVICERFAKSLHADWQVDDGCNDSALIFFSFHFKELSLSIGDKIEKVFSDLEIAALFKLSKDVLGEKAFKNHQDTSTNFTQTFIGLEKVVEQLQAGILNGPSITSTLLYLIVVPIVLIILWAIMCLLANWCCRPGLEVSVDPQSGKHDVGHIVR